MPGVGGTTWLRVVIIALLPGTLTTLRVPLLLGNGDLNWSAFGFGDRWSLDYYSYIGGEIVHLVQVVYKHWYVFHSIRETPDTRLPSIQRRRRTLEHELWSADLLRLASRRRGVNRLRQGVDLQA